MMVAYKVHWAWRIIFVLVILRRTLSLGWFGATGTSILPDTGQISYDSTFRRLLPQLTPHRDTSYIIEFVGDDPLPRKFMQPIVDRLEKDIETKVRTINIQQRPDFLTLFEAVGGYEAGQFPFFYNRRTRKAISGLTYYQNLLNLATGAPSVEFLGSFAELERMRAMRTTGLADNFKELIFRKSKTRTLSKHSSVSDDNDDDA